MARILVKLGDDIIKAVDLGLDPITFGRDLANDIAIDHVSISMQHAEIHYDSMAGQYIICDLRSTNGLLKGGRRIEESPMKDGDVFEVAKFRLIFEEYVTNATHPVTIVKYDELKKGFMDQTVIMRKAPKVTLRLKIGNEESELRITKHETVLGTGEGTDVCLKGWFVRRRHAVIVSGGSSFALDPIGATYVNEVRVYDRRMLRDGDIIRIRRNVIKFLFPE